MFMAKFRGVATLIVAGSVLAACSSLPSMHDMTGNIFKPKEEILPGERVAVLKSQSQITPTSAKINVVLPREKSNPGWTQPGGNASNAPENLTFSGALRQSWVADAGKGSSSDGQLVSRPIVFGGRIYTLDTQGAVTAFTASSGAVAWRTRLTPESEEKGEGYGGGLAVDAGRLYVATGYGTVVALEPSSGAVLWTKEFNVPIRTSPTAAQGKVFAVTTEGRVYCLNGADGEDIWVQRGLPEKTSILSNNSPAVSGSVVVVPYSSGEVAAYSIQTGRVLWTDSLAGARTNSIMSAVANPGRPAVYKGVVFAVGNAGRMIANRKKDGERLWNKVISSTQTPWPAGNMVYVVDAKGRAIAMTQKNGAVAWVTQLPGSGRWTGPVMAGGKLWLTSKSGKIVGLTPQDGAIATQRDLGYRINIAPVVASGHMYILTDNAKLLALN